MPASQIEVRRVREAVPGVLPADDMTSIATGGISFTSPISRGQGTDVVMDRQPADNPAEGRNTTGSCNNAFTYSPEKLSMREEAFCNTLSPSFDTGTVNDVSVAGGTITNPAGWPGVSVGDHLLVKGYDINPSLFLVPVAAVNGNDLTPDPDYILLQDEASGPSVRIHHDGSLRLGTRLLTATYELYNIPKKRGDVHSGVIPTQWSLSFNYPGSVEESWNLQGLARQKIDEGTRPTNTTAQEDSFSTFGSTNDFQAALIPDAGFGFRFNGAIMDEIFIQSLSIQLQNPVQTAGGAGKGIDPSSIDLDGEFSLTFSFSTLRAVSDTDAQIEALIEAADDPSNVSTFGFGFRDAAGNLVYYRLTDLQPSKDDRSGRAKTGRQTVDFEWTAKRTTLHTMIREFRFDA